MSLREGLATIRGGYGTWADLFAGPERPIWIQNLSDMQWSIDLDVGNGRTVNFKLMRTADPICITEEIPWKTLKESMEFQSVLNKTRNGQAIVRVLSEEQADTFYDNKAHSMNLPSSLAAYQHTQDMRKNLNRTNEKDTMIKDAAGNYTFAPPRTAMELAQQAAPGAQLPVDAAKAIAAAQGANQAGLSPYPVNIPPGMQVHNSEVPMNTQIRPRLMNLCAQVSMSLPASRRMDGEQFVREIVSMGETLSKPELEYVRTNGTYVSVTSWASKELARRFPLIVAPQVVSDNYGPLIEHLESARAQLLPQTQYVPYTAYVPQSTQTDVDALPEPQKIVPVITTAPLPGESMQQLMQPAQGIEGFANVPDSMKKLIQMQGPGVPAQQHPDASLISTPPPESSGPRTA